MEGSRWGEVGADRPCAAWSWRRLGSPQGTFALVFWPLHGGRGWTGTGKANQGVAWDLPWGPGALEELSQLEAPLADVTASSSQSGSRADTL